jgi:hypothetical protein
MRHSYGIKLFIQLVKTYRRRLKKMKKAFLLAILSFALVTALFTSAVRPAKAYINTYDWVGPTRYYDPYWGSYYLMFHPEGSVATLIVQVYNGYGWASSLNISAVKVYMDWNVNYSSTEVSETEPFEMPYNTYHWFTITFTVPATTTASNFFSHGWTIYVEEVNADGDVSSHDVWASSSGFYVYSTDQNDAMKLYDELEMIYDIYGWWPSFDDQAAYDMWTSGHSHYETGIAAYENGDFPTAKTQYGLALTAYNDALAAESEYDQAWQVYDDDYNKQWDAVMLDQEKADLAVTNAEAQAMLIEANATKTNAEANAEAVKLAAQAANTQALAWVIFGIGFMIIGIAACIWAFRRPTHT